MTLNLGMNHDFTDNGVDDPRFCPLDGNSCIGLGGVMDYYQETTNGWTCCSNEDMTAHFGDVAEMCLEEDDTIVETTPISNITTPISNITTPISNITTPISNITTPIANFTTPVITTLPPTTVPPTTPQWGKPVFHIFPCYKKS